MLERMVMMMAMTTLPDVEALDLVIVRLVSHSFPSILRQGTYDTRTLLRVSVPDFNINNDFVLSLIMLS